MLYYFITKLLSIIHKQQSNLYQNGKEIKQILIRAKKYY